MIKRIPREDIAEAISLINDVFSEFVSIDYSEQGKKTFEDYLKNKYEETLADIKSGHKKMWGYYQDGKIIGVISTRDVSHISLMFVDKKHHRRGIAKSLFQVVLEDLKSIENLSQITVNSSPYAVGVYEHLGFSKTGEKKERDGIVFVPMMRKL